MAKESFDFPLEAISGDVQVTVSYPDGYGTLVTIEEELVRLLGKAVARRFSVMLKYVPLLVAD